jgi:hypothetical protein
MREEVLKIAGEDLDLIGHFIYVGLLWTGLRKRILRWVRVGSGGGRGMSLEGRGCQCLRVGKFGDGRPVAHLNSASSEQ